MMTKTTTTTTSTTKMTIKTKTKTKTKTALRLILSITTLTGAIALTGNARGDATTAAATTTAPTFADLPVGRLTTPPAKKVDWVSGRESVPGLFVVSPAFNKMVPANQRQVAIMTDEKLATAMKSNGAFSARDEIPSGCISEMSRSPFDFDGRDGVSTTGGKKTREWSENLSIEASAYPRSADNPMSGVTAVHSERLVVDAASGAVTLESVDAFVDPATKGAKLIGKASLPLKLVRGPMFGMKVYAGRDERPDGKRFVQFVVVRPQLAKSSSSPSDRTSQMWTMHQDGNVQHVSGCGHLRVALPVEGAGKPADLATVVATVLLPSLDADGKETKTEATPTPTVAATPAISTTVAKQKGGKELKKPPPPPAPPSSVIGANDAMTKEREIRTRMMHIQVSVSQTSREKEPLVSVSTSWGNREQVERAVDFAPGAASPF